VRTSTRAWPQYVTTTGQIARAMLKVARDGAPKPVLETIDINSMPCSRLRREIASNSEDGRPDVAGRVTPVHPVGKNLLMR
jgi:hypothetical protein